MVKTHQMEMWFSLARYTGTSETQCFSSFLFFLSLRAPNLLCPFFFFKCPMISAPPGGPRSFWGWKLHTFLRQRHWDMIVLITGCTGRRRIRGSRGEPAAAVNRPVSRPPFCPICAAILKPLRVRGCERQVMLRFGRPHDRQRDEKECLDSCGALNTVRSLFLPLNKSRTRGGEGQITC